MRNELVALAAAAVVVSTATLAGAQPPPGTGTDMEFDPDAPPPPAEEKKEEAPLPPVEEGAWGVGGTEEEGRFAPGAGKKKKDEIEEEEEKKALAAVDLGPPGAVGADVVLGFGSIRDVNNDEDATDVFVASFLFGARYRFGKLFTLGLRFPFSTGSTEGPETENDDYDSFALGNIELSGKLGFQATSRIRIPVGVAIDLPLASGDPYPDASNQGAKAQALVAQSALSTRGFEEYALFASKRFGLVPMAGIEYAHGPLRIGASTKLELMFKAGGNDPPTPAPGTDTPKGVIHDPAYDWVTGVSGAYDFFGGLLSPGLRTWLAVARPPNSAGQSDYAGALWCAEIGVATRVPFADKGPALAAGLGFIFPIAGNLGGNASANGVRAQAGLAF